MAARETELLPVSYFHVVFTLPSAISDIAYHNKAVIYRFKIRELGRHDTAFCHVKFI